MSTTFRLVLACLPALAAIAAGGSLGKPAILCGGLAALPIVIVASLLGGRARDVRAALAATLSALALRLIGAVAAAIVLTLAFATDASAAIAALGLCLVGGLVVDTWAAWRTASADRKPLHA